MSALERKPRRQLARFVGLASSAVLIAACASAPESPTGATEVRSRLTALQANADLAGRARVELREAEAAVREAELPVGQADRALALHRVYMADRKVSIAESLATARYAQDQRAMLSEKSDAIRLQARTREADRALDDAAVARGNAARAREETALARSSEARARTESADARNAATAAQTANRETSAQAARDAAEYERRIDDLQAASTERGLVLTLGDVLFATDSATLQAGPNGNLDKLVLFLAKYPARSVVIEGHTDNVGAANYNRGLSQRRADSVMSYLLEKGVPGQSLSAEGMGMDHPVASNATSSGRQQNRRVEIIIENPAESVERPTR